MQHKKNTYTSIESHNMINCTYKTLLLKLRKKYNFYNRKFLHYTFTRVNMTNTFRFSDYDCIGFDLDNTLLRYNITNLTKLGYKLSAEFLVKQRGYDPKYLLQPLGDKELDFMQKGLILDTEKGNILRISGDGTIKRASHGTKLLSIQEISDIYPDQRWVITDAYCIDLMSTWNGHLSDKMRCLLDVFDMPSSILFARAVDTIDEEHGRQLNVYNVWKDLLDSLIFMYSTAQSQLNEKSILNIIKQNPELYLHKCSADVMAWLRRVKENHFTFLITGSTIEFFEFTMPYTFGDDWRSLFDIVICYAKKPGFFIKEEPFNLVVDYQIQGTIDNNELKQGEIYSRGNWKGVYNFFKRLSGKDNLRCLYIGDNLLQDIYVPRIYTDCDIVALIEEQMSEGMLYQNLIHPDEKILNSTFWGSYFRLKDSESNVDSFCGKIIKDYSKICIPTMDVIAQISLNEPLACFDKNDKKYSGYYPAIPLSLSDL